MPVRCNKKMCAVPAKHTMERLHIGHLIRTRLEEKGQTVTWLARQVPCSRTNIYKIFDRPSIDTDMLARLSDILGFDFFAALSDGLNRGK